MRDRSSSVSSVIVQRCHVSGWMVVQCKVNINYSLRPRVKLNGGAVRDEY